MSARSHDLEGPVLPTPRVSTLVQMLEAASGERTGLTFVDASERDTLVPWGEVYSRARKAATSLRARGLRRGDRVAIILPTGPGFCDAFFGAVLAGAVPVPLYPPVRMGRLDEYHRQTSAHLSASGARLVITDGRLLVFLGRSMERARPELGVVTAASLLAATPTDHVVDVSPTELALIQFSSGSTSDPKPVALTHAAIAAQCEALRVLMPDPDTGRLNGVSWLPLHHDMGLIGCLLTATYSGASLALIPPEVFLARPAVWLRAISRVRAAVSPAPSFAYSFAAARVKDEELRGVDLSCWKHALNGAEPVAVETLHRFTKRFDRFGFDPASMQPVYGLAEASLAATFSPRRPSPLLADHEGRSIASVGVPVPGVTIAIRDAHGHPLPLGQIGRIHVRGPSIMHGYFERPELTNEALVDGWLDTGDLGFVRQGELFVCGRSKDVVIIRGANHAPSTFEECLDGVEGVRAGCAVAVGHRPTGDEESLLLLVETTYESTSDLAERIARIVTERTGIRPGEVVLLAPGTLPRTSSGKLRRRESLRRHLAGELSPPAAVTGLLLVKELARSAAGLVASRTGS